MDRPISEKSLGDLRALTTSGYKLFILIAFSIIYSGRSALTSLNEMIQGEHKILAEMILFIAFLILAFGLIAPFFKFFVIRTGFHEAGLARYLGGVRIGSIRYDDIVLSKLRIIIKPLNRLNLTTFDFHLTGSDGELGFMWMQYVSDYNETAKAEGTETNKLVDEIHRARDRIVEILTAKLQDKFAKGKTVDMGSIVNLTPRGIFIDDRKFAYSDIEDISVGRKNDYMILSIKGEPACQLATESENFYPCLNLILGQREDLKESLIDSGENLYWVKYFANSADRT
jgi:hypothetical protein